MLKIQIIIIVVFCFGGVLFTYIPNGSIVQKFLIVSLIAIFILAKKNIIITKHSIAIILPYILYILYTFLSALIYTGSILKTVFNIQYICIGFLIYLWALNINITNYKFINKLISGIIVIQFLFVLLKLFVHKIDEKIFIGTMSHTAGQLGFLFPAIAIPFIVFSNYYQNYSLKKINLILFLSMMFLFGVLNEKRSFVFLFPFIILLSVIRIYNIKFTQKKFWSFLSVFLIIGFIGTSIGMSLIPSLNPEDKYGGNISYSYAIKYVYDYLTMDYGGNLQSSYEVAQINTSTQVGRIVLWKSILGWMLKQNILTLLFGVGSGSVTPSPWLHSDEDVLFSTIQTRGAISSAGVSFIENGLLGFLLINIFFVYSFWIIHRIKQRMHSHLTKQYLNAIQIVYIVFCFDFYFYSTILLRTFPMPFIFFCTLASIEHVRRNGLRKTESHHSK